MNKIYGTVAISNRHIHLTEETYHLLFDEDIEVKRWLNQKGEYAAVQTVTIEGPKNKIENVRVMGPFRSYNQVEVSKTDAIMLGINPPVRESGNIVDSEDIFVIGPKGKIKLNRSCIISERHIHMNEEKAKELNVKNNDMVKLIVNNDKGGIMNAFIKVRDNGYFEIHLDKDDANAFLLSTGDQIEIQK